MSHRGREWEGVWVEKYNTLFASTFKGGIPLREGNGEKIRESIEEAIHICHSGRERREISKRKWENNRGEKGLWGKIKSDTIL